MTSSTSAVTLATRHAASAGGAKAPLVDDVEDEEVGRASEQEPSDDAPEPPAGCGDLDRDRGERDDGDPPRGPLPPGVESDGNGDPEHDDDCTSGRPDRACDGLKR